MRDTEYLDRKRPIGGQRVGRSVMNESRSAYRVCPLEPMAHDSRVILIYFDFIFRVKYKFTKIYELYKALDATAIFSNGPVLKTDCSEWTLNMAIGTYSAVEPTVTEEHWL